MLALDPTTGILWGSALVAGSLASALTELTARVFSLTTATIVAGGWSLLLIADPTIGLHLVWNPSLGMAFFLASVVVATVVSTGRPSLLPVLVVLVSLSACSHTMLAMPALLMLLVTVVLCWRRSTTPPRKWLLSAVAVGIVCWLPPLIQQFFGRDPNLSALWKVVHQGPSLGLSFGLSALGHATPEFLIAPPTLITGEGAVTYLSQRSPLVGVLLLIVIVGGIAWGTRRQAKQVVALGWITLALAVGEVFSFSAVKERVTFGLTWTTIFLWAVAAMVTLLLGTIAVQQSSRSFRFSPQQLKVSSLVAVLILGCGATASMGLRSIDASAAKQAIAVQTVRGWIASHVARGPVRIAIIVDSQVGLDSASQLFGLEYLLRVDGYQPPNDQILQNGPSAKRGPLVFVTERNDVVEHIFIFKHALPSSTMNAPKP
jgi:hypothetical protein